MKLKNFASFAQTLVVTTKNNRLLLLGHFICRSVYILILEIGQSCVHADLE